jgi:voltage-gated potassium channel
MTTNTTTAPFETEAYKRVWLLGVSAAVAMVVGAFIPWFVGADSNALGTVGSFQIGVDLGAGRVATFAAVAAIGGWLTCRRFVAGLFSVIALYAASLTYTPMLTVIDSSWSVGWGYMLFVAGALLSLSAAVMVGSAVGMKEGRDRLRAYLDHHINPTDDGPKAVDTFIIMLIAFNVVSVIVQTEAAIDAEYQAFFQINETISTFIFSVEYVLRIWLSDLQAKYRGAIRGRARYARSPMSLVDFIAIVPFFLQFIEMDLRIARAIRLMRLIRILKMGRYARAVTTLYAVISRKKEELAITVFVSVMILVLSASCMFFAENAAQPEAFRSIPSTMWWAVVTLTSVGYGDVSPITGIGKLVGAVVCMVGVLVVALPTGILASGFMEVMREQRGEKAGKDFCFCPHCGEDLAPSPDGV